MSGFSKIIPSASKNYLSGIDKKFVRIPSVNDQSLNRKQLQWQARIFYELKRKGFRWFFVTLTYDDDHLPQTPFTFDGIDFNVSHFNRRHITLFWKRMRDYLGVGIRYYLCSEYGSTYGRPHYHALIGLPNMSCSVPEFLDIVQKCWYDEDTLDPLGFIMPNPEVTADSSTRDIYYLPHEFYDSKNIKRYYQGVEVKADQLPQMASYVSKYVLKDSYFYNRPEIDIIRKYSLNKRQYVKELNSINYFFLVDPEHYEFLCKELKFRYDLFLWLSEVGCFHRNSLGFGLDIACQFADLDSAGNVVSFKFPLGPELDKRLNEGINVGVKRDLSPMQCPLPDYIRYRLFYKNVRSVDFGQYHNPKKCDYYGRYVYRRKKTLDYCKHCELLVLPSIERKQSVLFRNISRWLTMGNDSINELLSCGLPVSCLTSHDDLLDVCSQLSVYWFAFRDTESTYPVSNWNDVNLALGLISKHRIYHNCVVSLDNSCFDVPVLEDDCPLYNSAPLFAPLENLLSYIDDRLKEESYNRYMSFRKQYDKLQDYADQTIRPQES